MFLTIVYFFLGMLTAVHRKPLAQQVEGKESTRLGLPLHKGKNIKLTTSTAQGRILHLLSMPLPAEAFRINTV